MVAEVIINRGAKKLNRTFDYNIPKELEDLILVGSKVLVPFGRSKNPEEAFVVKLKEKSEYEIKSIIKIEENLTDEQINKYKERFGKKSMRKTEIVIEKLFNKKNRER